MIDTTLITQAIVSTPSSPVAREQAGALVEEWIREHAQFDSTLSILHVELGFTVWLDSSTLIIGVQDMIARDQHGILGNEWKTTAPAGRSWNQERWLEEISRGPQIAVYALAQRQGTFYEKDRAPFELNIETPRVRVRAIVKSNPPQFWPNYGTGIFEFPGAKLDRVASALLAKAESIRAMRRTAYLPWQLPGKQCFDFGKECVFFKEFCAKNQHPEGIAVSIFDPSDPAFSLSLPHVDPERLLDPNLVVLSASSYQTVSACPEKYRIIAGQYGDKDGSLALDIGSCFHSAVAEYYRQVREDQAGVAQ